MRLFLVMFLAFDESFALVCSVIINSVFIFLLLTSISYIVSCRICNSVVALLIHMLCCGVQIVELQALFAKAYQAAAGKVRLFFVFAPCLFCCLLLA